MSNDTIATEKLIDRTELAISVVIQLSIVGITITSLVDQPWLAAFSGTAVFLLTLVPPALERKLHICLPVEVTLFVCVYLYVSFALGEVNDFYEQLWW